MSQKNAESRVSQSGWISQAFQLQRGCRQGDPLSPYVLILCAELLSKSILNNKDIKGIKVEGKEKKLTQFADDTSIFLDGSKRSLRKTLSVLNRDTDLGRTFSLQISNKSLAIGVGEILPLQGEL